MAKRMARQGRKPYLTELALALVLAASIAAPACAEATQPQAPMPPLSGECQPGAAQATSQTPLPNVANVVRERSRFVILAVGASPSLRREQGSYYGLVENLLEQTFKGLQVEIVHRGVSGELARDAGERIKMEVGLSKPDLVLWQLGTADALARMPVEDFEESVTKTIVWLKSHNIDVALIGLHYVKAVVKDEHYQAVRRVLKKVAAEQGVLRIGRYDAIETIARLKSEQGAPMSGTHIAEAAYECSAEYLARAIASGLFLKGKPTKPQEPRKP